MIHKGAWIHESARIWHEELSNIGKCVIGEDSVIHSHVWIGDDVIIGKRVRVQAFSFIPNLVHIEDDVFIGPRVTFTNDPKIVIQPGQAHWKMTFVRKGAKIGAGVVVLAGVTIGEGAFVGMGSIVTKSIPPGEMWFGNPARRIKKVGG